MNAAIPRNAPEFVAVGHLTRDLLADGPALGGAAAYAALAADRLGLRAGIVTSAGPDLEPGGALADIAVACVPAPATTTFENHYDGATRRQRLLARAADLRAADVPPAWRAAPLVLIAPVAAECAPDLLAAFPKALIGLALQGWLRAWNADGRVRFTPWADAPAVLPRARVAFLSAEDVAPAPGLIAAYAALVPYLVVTLGADGADIHHAGTCLRVPALRRPAVDPTGAGDVFAAAFLVEFARTGDARTAARFGHAAASYVIESPGPARIPDRRATEARLAAEAR